MLAAFQAVLKSGDAQCRPGDVQSLYKILATIEIAGLGLWWLYSRDNNIGVLIFGGHDAGRLSLDHAGLAESLMEPCRRSFMQTGHYILGGNNLDLPSVHGAGMALIDKGYAWSVAIQGTGSTHDDNRQCRAHLPLGPLQAIQATAG